QPRDEQEYDLGHDPVKGSRLAQLARRSNRAAGAAAWPVTSATVAMVANRPASAYSVRSMTALTGSVRGSASSCSTVWPGGALRCAIGLVAVASVTNVTW